jgi:hypothetical protein
LSSAKAAVIEATHQRGPARPHITESRGEFGFARELAHGCVGPSGQCLGNRLRLELAPLLSLLGRRPVDGLLDCVELGYAIERFFGDG